MTLAQCGKQKNAAAWKGKSSKGSCFAFYWNSDRPNLPQIGEGHCYILDKVVPLGSQDPPPWIFTKYNPQDILHIA
jgi:hypothetical protein